MKSNKSLFLLSLLFVSIALQAQKAGVLSSRWSATDGLITSNSTVVVKGGNGYEGTPFLNEDFQAGKIVFDSTAIDNVLIRYNVAYESMQLSLNGEASNFSDESATVFINDKQYEFYDYTRKGKSLGGYFQVIYENPNKTNDAKLLLKNFKKLVDGGKMKLGDLTKPKDELKDKSAYYILLNGIPRLAERRERDFLTIFNTNVKDKVKEYIGENNLKPRKEDDLVEIVKYYNQIKK